MTDFQEMHLALKQRRLEIDCIEITLKQNDTTDPILFKGKGYIQQTDKDTLRFKLYATETVNTDWRSHFKSLHSIKCGELYTESHFYNLTATALDGSVWTADRVIPSCNWPTDGVDPIVSGDLSVISTELAPSKAKHFLRLCFFDEVKLPFPGEKFEFSDGAYHFRLEKHDSEFFIEVDSTDPLGEDFHIRIKEALRFVLAKTVYWRVHYSSGGQRYQFRISSGPLKSQKTELFAPIGREFVLSPHNWRLFADYLQFVTKSTPAGFWHICSYHLHNACESSANSLDAWANGLCIAVEGISHLIESETEIEDKELIQQMNAEIFANISGNPDFVKFAGRLKGLLGLMLNRRPQDRLRPLVDSGHIEKEYLKTWQALRNKGVHPGKVDLEAIEPSSVQLTIDKINQVTTLMYQTVFYLVGYEGKFTDYGVRDFPIKNYPLNRRELEPDQPSEPAKSTAGCLASLFARRGSKATEKGHG